MPALNIRTVVARLVLISGLAVLLATGTFASMKQSHASAAPMTETCQRWKNVAFGYAAIANLMYANGLYAEANYYWDVAGVYYDNC
jgi:hypothetical protein